MHATAISWPLNIFWRWSTAIALVCKVNGTFSYVWHLVTYARNDFPAPAVIEYDRMQKCEAMVKRLLTNSRTPQNPRLPSEPVAKWLRLKQPLSGALCPFLQKVSQPLPEIQTRQPVSDNMRPIIWASSIFQHSMLLVVNSACEVCSVLYRGVDNNSFEYRGRY